MQEWNFIELQFGTKIIIENNQERLKHARKFKNQSYNNYDEEDYSRTPNLYINREVFEEWEGSQENPTFVGRDSSKRGAIFRTFTRT